MKYEMDLLEEWVTGPDSGEIDTEAARIRVVFMNMALSHKKQNYLQRYFRLHRESLTTIIRKLQEKPLTKKNKQALAAASDLAAWMDDHLVQYLAVKKEVLDPDDPDIDAHKVITTFSLPELGVIIRLFIETGLFRVRNQKALTRFMSRNVAIRTRHVPETFSEDHLYNAIHSPGEPAMDRLQEMLNKMLTRLQKLRSEERKKEKK